MKLVKRTILLAEIVATVYLVDFAFGLMSQPSDLLLLSGICILFLVFIFWTWRYSRYKQGQLLKKAQDLRESVQSPWIPSKENEGEKHDATKQDVASNPTPIDTGRVR